VTGHDDRLVRIWDSATGGLLHTLKGSGAVVTTVHFAPDGQRVAAGAADGGVLVWSLETEDVVARLAPQEASIGCVRWSSHGDRLLVTTGSWSERDAAELVVWSPSEDVVLARHALSAPAAATQWLDDDRIVLVAGWDGQSSLWNVASGAPTAHLQLAKDMVSAAHWSADCPLAPQWLVDQFVAGAE
jgi:WD40 repeat protein